MANRENQGLQIAVMIFFLLVVLLAVTTYVFFKNYDDGLKKISSLETERNEARSQASSAQDEINIIKTDVLGLSIDTKLGDPENPEEGTILFAFNQDMDKYAGNVNEEEKNYRKVLEVVHTARAAQEEAAKLATEEAEDWKQKHNALEKAHEAQIAAFNDAVSKEKDAFAQAKQNLETERESAKQGADKVAALLESKRGEFTDLKAEKEATITELSKQVDKLVQINQSIRDRNETLDAQTDLESPDGEITWVNQRTNLVWINLGQNDLLQRQTKFAVYPSDENDLVIDQKKGSIEVTRIIDGHMAEARLTDFDISNPIVPGDKIHSPVWERGRREGFALAGFIDIDGDGRSDRAKVRELIRLNGGKIDAEVDDEGKTHGKLELTTRKLIMGEVPTDKSKQAVREAFSRLVDQAQQVGIPKVSLQKFVNQMGWRSDDRTVPLGKGAKSRDFPAEPYEGRRTSNGNTSGRFKTRTAPPSAY